MSRRIGGCLEWVFAGVLLETMTAPKSLPCPSCGSTGPQRIGWEPDLQHGGGRRVVYHLDTDTKCYPTDEEPKPDRSAAELLTLLLDLVGPGDARLRPDPDDDRALAARLRAVMAAAARLEAEARRAVERELQPYGEPWPMRGPEVVMDLRYESAELALLRKLVREEGCPYEWDREKNVLRCAYCEGPTVDPEANEVAFRHAADCIWPELARVAGEKPDEGKQPDSNDVRLELSRILDELKGVEEEAWEAEIQARIDTAVKSGVMSSTITAEEFMRELHDRLVVARRRTK
jgi:hypothetical protein